MGVNDYDATVETLTILADAETVAELRAGLDELARGDTSSVAEVRLAMKQAGRPAE